AETRLVPGKAAASEEARRILWVRAGLDGVICLRKARTTHGAGWAGEKSDFFSNLFEGNARFF
ncbi:MAG: hypothetical protein ABI604_18925, partial [Nitrospirota bacterium]